MKKLFLIVLILLIIVLSIIYKSKINKTTITNSVVASGTIEANEVDLSFKIPGRVKEINVEEGDKIKKGDIVAKIDSGELEARFQQAEASLNQAKSAYEETKSLVRPQELKIAEANHNAAYANLENIKKNLERVKNLYKENLTSHQNLEDAETAYKVAEAQYQTAKENLSLAKEGARENFIERAREQVKKASAELKYAKVSLDNAVIRSPIEGYIVSKNVEVGEVINPATPVITIANLNKLFMKVYISEKDLGFIKIGQKAIVKVDTYPDRIYEGTITYISPEAEFTPKNIQTKEDRSRLVFKTKIELENPALELKPGMPADVEILLK